LQGDAPDWPTGGMNYVNLAYPHVRAVRDQYHPGAEIWVDEFAEDPGMLYNGQYLSDRVVGALWAADLLGRYAEQGTDVNFRFLFKGKPDHYYALVDVNNEPRPEYYTYWLYAQVMGDKYVAVQPETAQYTLRGESYGGNTVTLNGQPVSKSQLAGGLTQVPEAQASPCPHTTVSVPAYSAMFILFGN
jgi:hypothetical protein